MPSPSRPTGAPAAAANMTIAHWATSVPAARAQFGFAPPDAAVLQALSEALRNLGRAKVFINVGRIDLHNYRRSRSSSRNDRNRIRARIDCNRRGARHFLGRMISDVAEARARLAAVQPDEYVDRQLARVLRDAHGSVSSTFADFHRAGINYGHAKWRLERAVARMRRERV